MGKFIAVGSAIALFFMAGFYFLAGMLYYGLAMLSFGIGMLSVVAFCILRDTQTDKSEKPVEPEESSE